MGGWERVPSSSETGSMMAARAPRFGRFAADCEAARESCGRSASADGDIGLGGWRLRVDGLRREGAGGGRRLAAARFLELVDLDLPISLERRAVVRLLGLGERSLRPEVEVMSLLKRTLGTL